MKIIQEPKIISQVINRLLGGSGDNKVVINIITIGTIDVHGHPKPFIEITEDINPLVEMQEVQAQLIKKPPLPMKALSYRGRKRAEIKRKKELPKISKETFIMVLKECNNNQREAARRVGLNYSTFRSRFNAFGLEKVGKKNAITIDHNPPSLETFLKEKSNGTARI